MSREYIHRVPIRNREGYIVGKEVVKQLYEGVRTEAKESTDRLPGDKAGAITKRESESGFYTKQRDKRFATQKHAQNSTRWSLTPEMD